MTLLLFEPSTLDPLSAIQFSSKERKEFFQKYYSEVGRKPKQSADGTVPLVIDYFKENLNDPYSMKFVRWSNIALHGSCKDSRPCWLVSVKYRAKNEFGAYILTENTFEIKSEKVSYKFDGILKPDFNIVDSGSNISTSKLPVPKLPASKPVTGFQPLRIVKAQTGDTVAKIAARFGVPAIEVAKFNGLSNAVNSLLPAGREIRIPSR